MKTISSIKFFSTNLSPDFTRINSIEIEDSSFGGGGFGEVYRAVSINKLKPKTDQVIKILIDNGQGSAKKGLETIRKLQHKLIDKNNELINNQNKTIIELYPAFLGVPQFSFEGQLDGKLVIGYSSNDLVTAGFIEFKEILDDDRLLNQYQQNIPLHDKMSLSYQLVSAFELLRNLLYIHADFKAEALFINLKTKECAIIDYDSGAVMENPNDKPTTFGAMQDWLAPEIIEQIKDPANHQRITKVDLFSDIWSVTIGIHYLLFTIHPLFYLTEISQRSITSYCQQFKWPDANTGFSFFNRQYATYYTNYKNFISNVPQDIVKQLANTINNGLQKPSQRTSYGQWLSILKSTQKSPEIKFLNADRMMVTDHRPVRFTWQIDYASTITINNNDVTGKASYEIQINKDTIFILKASNAFGDDKQALKIEVSKAPPLIKEFKADKTILIDNTHARLSWQIVNAYKIVIDNGIGDVSSKNYIDVTPIRDTVYTLTAISYFNVSATSTVKIKVYPPPQIVYFNVDNINKKEVEVLPNAFISISWKVLEAQKVILNNNGTEQNIPAIGELSVNFSQDSHLLLKAIGAYITTEENILIKVAKIPLISFQIKNISSITDSDINVVELNWSVKNAKKQFITDIGEVAPIGKKQLTIDTPTTYTLVAHWLGKPIEKSVVTTPLLTKLPSIETIQKPTLRRLLPKLSSIKKPTMRK